MDEAHVVDELLAFANSALSCGSRLSQWPWMVDEMAPHHRLLPYDDWGREDAVARMVLDHGTYLPADTHAAPRLHMPSWRTRIGACFGVMLIPPWGANWLTHRDLHLMGAPGVANDFALVICVTDVSCADGICLASRDDVTGEMEVTHLGVGDMLMVRHAHAFSALLVGRSGTRFSALGLLGRCQESFAPIEDSCWGDDSDEESADR